VRNIFLDKAHKICLLSCLCFFSAIILPVYSICLAADMNDMVLIRQVVDSRYDNNSNISNTNDIINNSIKRKVKVVKGINLSKIISNEYGVGKSNAKAAYEAFELNISELNGLDTENNLTAGSELFIPDLPRIGLTKPSKSNKYNNIPKLIIAEDHENKINGSKKLLTEKSILSPRHVDDTFRIGAKDVAQLNWVSRSDAEQIMKINKNATVDCAPVDILIASNNAGLINNREFLSSKEKDIISESLLANYTRMPTLVILDDSWPDKDSFMSSKKYILHIINAIRNKYKMGPSSISKDVINATDTTYTENKSHAIQIKMSLDQLVKLDTTNKVNIIYIPLSKNQLFSKDIMTELISINLIAKHMANSLGDEVPGSLQKEYLNLAKKIVSNISNVQDSVSIKSDQAIVESVFRVLKMYSEISNEPFVLNMSWTIPDLYFQLYIPSDSYGVYVTAAGNMKGRNIHKDNIQFASRSITPGDMLAVVNINDDGNLACDSNSLELESGLPVYGLAFSGAIEDSVCGTSFSAPRVAWLIAAWQSVAQKKSLDDRYLWQPRIKSALASLTKPSDSNFNKIRLSPSTLFGCSIN